MLKMSRLDRLVLDAVEKHSPKATVVQHIWPYVNERRWCFSAASLYPALARLERKQLISSRWDDNITEEELERRGGHRRRIYFI
jgi:DNA-binding PadR family transcriptional regulator